ncbi:MAG TPA: patatin-like phospholipase family protein [Nostoc sp.]|uniref:patatin-like phospholipase family protein n=1 Tax=Nostoc sp. TaxID=1180 RepID=UPI002D63AEAD|nr:patatin-like phospholipase family protein [Nostoc sp.]HYX15769.1 patatin-like phospholipase family protein [Nostoc sp.]
MTFKAAVLSIDGGGIKGIVPAMILAAIEDKTGKPICELFDFIAGTSTGGILALGLTRPSEEDSTKPKFTAKELVNLYRKEGRIIFQRRENKKLNVFHKKVLKAILDKFAPEVKAEDLFSRKYTRKGKEDVINNYLGDTCIEKALTEVLITSYATNFRKPIFFTNNLKKEQEYETSQCFRVICKGYKMRDAALATSAAPTYFKPYRIDTINHRDKEYTLVDGGVFANNPTSIAIIEAMNSYKAKTGDNISLDDLLVVSVGTGRKVRGLDIKDIAGWGQIKWIEPLIDMTLNGQSEVVDYQMEQLLSTKLQNKTQDQQQYYRFQPQYSETKNSKEYSISGNAFIYVNDNMDDASDDNISNLLGAANRFIDMERENLERLSTQLLTIKAQFNK